MKRVDSSNNVKILVRTKSKSLYFYEPVRFVVGNCTHRSFELKSFHKKVTYIGTHLVSSYVVMLVKRNLFYFNFLYTFFFLLFMHTHKQLGQCKTKNFTYFFIFQCQRTVFRWHHLTMSAAELEQALFFVFY